MKKHFYLISFYFLFFVTTTKAIDFQVTCQGTNMYNLSATCPQSAFNYIWEVLKDGTPIVNSPSYDRTFSYSVNPLVQGEGSYQIRVKYWKTVVQSTKETSSSYFCSILNSDFSINSNSGTNIDLCDKSPDSLFIDPVSGTLTEYRVKIYTTTGFGGTAGTLVVNQTQSLSYPTNIFSNLSAGGYYLVEFTAYGSCGSEQKVKYIHILNTACKFGTWDIEESNSVVAYPNPVESVLSVSGIEKINKAKVYNTQGELKKSFEVLTDSSIDLSNLESGIYFLHLYKIDGEIIVEKIIKK